MKEIRLLTEDEIVCRVSQVAKDNSWCSILLFKNARVDMNILDEVFGPLGWKRTHEVINNNLFCTVSVWDNEKSQWISKQDVGVPSFADGEKGEASDAFKRACFNVGIGRELYTAPAIFVSLTKNDINNKGKVKTRFLCTGIGYDEKNCINRLTIVDEKGKVRYRLNPDAKLPQGEPDETQSDDLSNALTAINGASSKDELMTIYNQFPALKDNRDFMKALSNRKAEIL